MTRIVSGLKDIALALEIPVGRHRGGRPRRAEGQAPAQPPPARQQRHQLRERHHPDPEHKYHIVAKVNIEFNPYQAQRYRDWVVATVEKNRGGQDNVDLEYEKLFEFSCFDPPSCDRREALEERLYNE